MAEAVLLTIANGVARVVFNRPEALNAFNEEVALGFITHMNAIEADNSVRCVVLEGAGDHFCAGGDIKMFKDMITWTAERRFRHYRTFLNQVHVGLLTMMRMPKPVVAKVQGAAAGIGLSFALAADLAIAADDAKFTMAYNQLGVSPDGSSSFFLPRTVGLKKAKELAFLGERFDAAAALDFGIVNRVVPRAELDATIDALSARLASGATQAIGRTKILMNQSFDSSAVEQLDAET
ncbi:MAG: enoyl-CoA hydratase/isomerase family protein, partial [Alphaproteobacteria bacterium]|nr:enoyl-CoA hydratase/isomerase family protein [Alphaproteobacteria bacterium]